jgi:acyl-CoA thioesterase FadM
MNARAAIHVAGHVNNAVYWQLLEEELAEHAADATPRSSTARRAAWSRRCGSRTPIAAGL